MMEEHEDYNGLRLGGVLIPQELVDSFLAYLPIQEVVKASEVLLFNADFAF
jgi:hypothetical protein